MRGKKPTPKPQKTPTKPELLTPPSSISDAAKREWQWIVKILEPSKVLNELDRLALMILASSYATYIEAEAKVQELGLIVVGTTGTPITNPYLKVQKESWERVRPLLAEFGLTPSSRARLQIGDGNSDELTF